MSCWNKPSPQERKAMADALDAQRIAVANVDAARGADAVMAKEVRDRLDAQVVRLKMGNCWLPGCSGCHRVS